MRKFETIRKAAALPEVPIGESCLRGMVKRGECPGIYSGTRFLVNVDALLDLLERKSAEGARL